MKCQQIENDPFLIELSNSVTSEEPEKKQNEEDDKPLWIRKKRTTKTMMMAEVAYETDMDGAADEKLQSEGETKPVDDEYDDQSQEHSLGNLNHLFNRHLLLPWW